MDRAPSSLLRHGDLVRIRGERWRIEQLARHDTVAIVDAVGCEAGNRSTRARFLLPFELVDRLHSSSPRLVGRARWRHTVRRTLANALPSWSSLGAAARANVALIPFQLEPAMALARGDGCRFLLADAVGLGKTVEAGLMIAETLQRRADARVLVVSPAGLRDQWRDELKNRFRLDADILDGPGLARTAARLPAGVNPWAVSPLVITSIDYVKRPEVLRSLEALTWDVMVLDEAHHLTGRSDRAAAAAVISGRARSLVALTATPHSGDDQAFARLCSLGDAGGSEPLIAFRRTHADAGFNLPRRASMLRVRPTAAEAAMHAVLLAYAQLVWNQSLLSGRTGARLAVTVLARRACSSAGSLVRSIQRRLSLLNAESPPQSLQPGLPFVDAIEDDEPHALLQPPGLPDGDEERRRLDEILELARAAATRESKIAALRRFMSRVGEPAIVFTEYRDTLKQLSHAFSDVDALQLHGGLTARERAEVVREFTRGHARLLLATDAGSEGLNLHDRCRLVVNLELPWTPLRLEQRAGRVDRIGQRRRVHAVHLVAADTYEEATLARLAARIRRMQGAMSLFTKVPDEERVAESILGKGATHDLVVSALTCPPGIVTPRLSADARGEALRMAGARALSTAGTDERTERPVITRIRRHGARPFPECLWVYKVALTTASGRLLWEALLPVSARLAGPWRDATTRALLGTNRPFLTRTVENGVDNLLRELRGLIRPAIERWSRRESDLQAALRASHARLSAELLQPGLFDRRGERLAAAQASTLDEALSESASRLRDLDHAADPRVDTSELEFGVLFE